MKKWTFELHVNTNLFCSLFLYLWAYESNFGSGCRNAKCINYAKHVRVIIRVHHEKIYGLAVTNYSSYFAKQFD